MASWSREGRLRGGRPPLWLSGREAVEYVPVRPPQQRLLDQLLSDMQSHLDEMEKMRSALIDAYPLFWAGRGGCSQAQPEKADPEEAASYRFSLDVAGFAPEELSVQMQGRRLTVRAKRDRRTETADGCVSHEYREVRKEVVLPDDADLAAVSCALDGGRLCVRAPRLALPAAEPKTIPIAVGRTPASPAADRKAPPPDSPEKDAGGAAAAAAASS